MARAPMVTRELIGTEANVLVVDTVNAATDYKQFTVQGKYKTTDHLLKAIKKVYEDETRKIVKIIDSKEVHKLYGIEVKSSIFDGFVVFLTEDDRETWFDDFFDNTEALGLEFHYNQDLTRNEDVYDMYEKAKTLKITYGKVYIG